MEKEKIKELEKELDMAKFYTKLSIFVSTVLFVFFIILLT